MLRIILRATAETAVAAVEARPDALLLAGAAALPGGEGARLRERAGAAGIALVAELPAAGAAGFDPALAAALALGVTTVALARAAGPGDIEHLALRLAVAEARAGLAEGSVTILAAVAADGPGLLALAGGWAGAARPPRLVGLATRFVAAADAGEAGVPRGAAAAAWAAGSRRIAEGPEAAVGRALARNLVAAAAEAAGVAALDAPGAEDLALEVAALVRAGFAAVILRRPEDVALARAAARGVTSAR